MQEPQSIPIYGPDNELVASRPQSASSGRAWAGSALWVWICLAALIGVGAYLRLAKLGHLGIHQDEDLSSLAVRAILQKGIPELPSGMVYLRGGPFLYAMAASAKLFGFDEFALRLPAALFGIAMIPLGYVFGRALFGVRVGLVVAALLAISMWDIEFSRYARMYAAFSFFYVLTIWCIWKFRVRSESLAGGMLCVLLATLTISLHQLGYTLAAAMFFPLILRGPGEWLKPRRLAFPICAALLIAAFFFAWGAVLDHLRMLPFSAPGVLAPAGRFADAAEITTGLPQLALLPNWL
ncbi:MAG TPA: glycosyltransferase family 39 protein, partial [Gammaproteobacteria bacterium]|nr:glycosyltransferase family 39 protein [Gammaproteobacteria bacterium]